MSPHQSPNISSLSGTQKEDDIEAIQAEPAQQFPLWPEHLQINAAPSTSRAEISWSYRPQKNKPSFQTKLSW